MVDDQRQSTLYFRRKWFLNFKYACCIASQFTVGIPRLSDGVNFKVHGVS